MPVRKYKVSPNLIVFLGLCAILLALIVFSEPETKPAAAPGAAGGQQVPVVDADGKPASQETPPAPPASETPPGDPANE